MLHQFSVEDATAVICGLANLGHVPAPLWFKRFLATTHALSSRMGPKHVTGICWAVARLSLKPYHEDDISCMLQPRAAWLKGMYASAAARPSNCSAVQLVRLMWAVSVLGHEPGNTWVQEAEHRLIQLLAVAPQARSWLPYVTDLQQAYLTNPPVDQLSEVSSEAPVHEQTRHAPIRPADGSQQQVMVAAQSAGQLQDNPDGGAGELLDIRSMGDLLECYTRRVQQPPQPVIQYVLSALSTTQQLTAVPLSHITKVLYHCQRLHMQPGQRWLSHLAAALQGRLQHVQPTDAAQLLCALGDLGFNAQQYPEWRDSFLSRTAHLMPGCNAQQLSTLLKGMASSQLEPPSEWLQALLGQLRSQFRTGPSDCLSMAVASLARLGYRPSNDFIGDLLLATHRAYLAATGPPDVRSVVTTMWALGLLQWSPGPRWMKAMLRYLHAHKQLLDARSTALLFVSLARLRCRPSHQFLQRLLDGLGNCESCSCQDLSNIAWAIATLGWRPDESWVSGFVGMCGLRLRQFTDQGFVIVLWALATLRVTPPVVWRVMAKRVLKERMGGLTAQGLCLAVWACGYLRMWFPGRYGRVHNWSGQLHRGYARGSRTDRKRHVGSSRRHFQGSGRACSNGKDSKCSKHSKQSRPCLGLNRQITIADTTPRDSKKPSSRLKRKSGGKYCPMTSNRPSGLVPRDHMLDYQLQEHVLKVLGSFTAGGLVRLLRGMAKLRQRPRQAWLHAVVMNGSKESLGALSGPLLVLLAYSLAKLQYCPEAGWLRDLQTMLEVKYLESTSIRATARFAMGQLQKRCRISGTT